MVERGSGATPIMQGDDRGIRRPIGASIWSGGTSIINGREDRGWRLVDGGMNLDWSVGRCRTLDSKEMSFGDWVVGGRHDESQR